MKIGDNVVCKPTAIGPSGVTVCVEGTDAIVKVSIREVFGAIASEELSIHSGSIVSRIPYDIIRIDRPFIAKVTSLIPLSISRAERVADLWSILERRAARKGCVEVTVTGQNREEYFLSLEGNIFFRTPKVALMQYLSDTYRDPVLLHKYTPVEGDNIVAQVVFASKEDWKLSVDLVAPLVVTGKLETWTQIMAVLGVKQQSSQTNDENCGVTVTTAPRESFNLRIAHSSRIDRIRDETFVIIIDDCQVFGTYLARLMCEMGYTAESTSDAEQAINLAGKTKGPICFIVDYGMEPIDGVKTVQLLAMAVTKDHHQNIKFIIMSGNEIDDCLNMKQGSTIREVIEPIIHCCAWWCKTRNDSTTGLVQLDDMIVMYDDYRGKLPPRETAPLTIDETKPRYDFHDVPFSNVLQEIVDRAKIAVGADWGALFEMDPSLWHVNILAGDGPILAKSEEIGAQSYLPNSPIRDLSYRVSQTLFEPHVVQQIPIYRNLLRFFGPGSIHDPIDMYGLASVAGVRLNIGTAKRYTLFMFWRRSTRLHEVEALSALQHAVTMAELALVRMIHAEQIRTSQPFYLEGLARTGLRHDAICQITNIQMVVQHALCELTKNHSVDVSESLKDIYTLAKQAEYRVRESIEHLRDEKQIGDFNLIDVVDRAIEIARGVGSRLMTDQRQIIFGKSLMPKVPCVVLGDATILQRILENLLVNAVEHGLTFGRSPIMISVLISRSTSPERPIDIVVVDNGPGIHGVDMHHVFEALFSTKPGGYGMGLAVARRLADEHGLMVTLRNSAVLSGSVFAVSVPLSMGSRKKDF